MAFNTNDQLYTQSFTPREYQVELLYAAKARNIIICLDKLMEKIFISTKLTQEMVISNRRPISKGGKRVIYLLKNKELCDDKATHFKYLTDLRVLKCCSIEDFNLPAFCDEVEILILTIDVCYLLLKDNRLNPDHINLLIIDHCHELVTSDKVNFILNRIRENSSIRIVGFAVPLFSLAEEPGHLSYELERIETFYQCRVETANDVFFILHYNRGLKEHWIEFQTSEVDDVEPSLRECVMHTLEFLNDHRFDPLEIYTEMYYEEIRKIPDPIKKPCEMIDHFLNILSNLGVWCADRAALIYLIQLEKFKVKTPYERHYLLLCVVSTLFLKVRALCSVAFQDLSEEERIYKFSKPKIHRLLETLKNFSPPPQDKSKVSKSEEKPAHFNHRRYNNYCRSHRNFVRPPRAMYRNFTNPDLLCGIIFVENELLAKVLFYLLNELSKSELNHDFSFLSPLYLSEKSSDDQYAKDAEAEHKKQEEVLKKFRIHECNLLLATSILEQGIELPKCNLVMRFDFPQNYQSYVQCKSRAKSSDALYVMMIPAAGSEHYLRRLAHYHYVEKLIMSKCFEKQPPELQEKEADAYASLIPSYCPLGEDEAPKVSFNSAIALVNKYCAKLPSDTFTRLTPECRLTFISSEAIACSLRLPINSPLKYVVSSYAMPSVPLAKRMAALKLCVALHRENELDDYLMPIGKENFVAHPEDMEVLSFPEDEIFVSAEARPGTTKRRQYYYKKLAESLSGCRPESNKPCYLYHVNQTLTCPLPEEQNTRGRRIYPPEKSDISFGILTTKKIPQICSFPIYTRSGEVQVDLKLVSQTIILDEEQINKIKIFVNYTFTKVLKLQRYMMLFDPNVSENSYFVVPVSRERTSPSNDLVISWNFLDLIFESRNVMPETIPEDVRKSFQFDAAKYRDAVVMPWYRNQDQPQYFYVAEICYTLNPKSDFPGTDYGTFEEYYLKKYGIQIQNLDQPLLDVDHTSARLNFLTPRYVNRKGVALPTSSEATKRAKRENLEQKQILIAELCSIHPFPSSLWRQAVCLPCILYRINSLLLANQIRVKVAQDIGLGKETPNSDFHWPPLDFGWSLADVLNKGRKQKEEAENVQIVTSAAVNGDKIEEVEEEREKECGDELEIGTWSNEMVDNHQRYASPTYDSEDYSIDNDSEEPSEDSEDDSEDDEEEGGIVITYMGENQAEAVDNRSKLQGFIEFEDKHTTAWELKRSEGDDIEFQKHIAAHRNAINDYEKTIMDSGLLIQSNCDIVIRRKKVRPYKSDSDDSQNRRYTNCVVEVAKQFQEELINKPTVQKSLSLLSDIRCQYTLSSPLTTSKMFSFDYQPDLNDHPGPSPSLLLQALTMSNANDGINLERLETIGDSFLKYAITTYLYSTYENIHEGKLSHLRSKQVSNLNLYRLGKRKMLGESMIATKFEPHDNWLPPCYYVPKELEQALIESGVPSSMWNEVTTMDTGDFRKVDDLVREAENKLNIIRRELSEHEKPSNAVDFIPYNLITQHSIPDKSIADCVEALIGAYLIACGPKGALLFMTWLGINVVPKNKNELSLPYSPLLRCVSDNPEQELIFMLDGYEELENLISYQFRDRSYLLQAFTHASYQPNQLTDCYQRLEFLGDAVLDYLITRHLYEDQRQHSPGALTDLRSALVNNTIFASLAVRCGFHKYFRHLSPGLHSVINRFVCIQEENGHQISEEYCFVGEQEDGCEEAEDVEVPKALGDVFESLAGAIFLDSDMSLDAVWAVYYKIMHSEIEQFSSNVPKSPIRELLELEPETAKFSRPEKLADGRRVRVTVDVFGKGSFKGIGRNYRIAKCTAAKCALKKLKKRSGLC